MTDEQLEPCDLTKLPWIGPQYRGGGLMLLGESHYGLRPAHDNPGATRMVIGSVVGGQRLGYHRNVARMVRGQAEWEDVPEFWNSVVFWNIVQRSMINRGERPNDRDLRIGYAAFISMFAALPAELLPGRILVLTRLAMTALQPFEGPARRPLEFGGCRSGPGSFKMSDGRYVAVTDVDHPSSVRGRRLKWRPLVAEFLNHADYDVRASEGRAA